MGKESSFFEKLKKGMGAKITKEEIQEIPKEKKLKKTKKIEMRTTPVEPEVEKEEPRVEKEEVPETKKTKEEKKEIKESLPTEVTKNKEKWFETEGELAIDVYQTEKELVIQSAIAGVKRENLDILIEGDLLTIKGKREKPFDEGGDYFTQECYWGPFSREIILPVEVDPNRVEASMKEGILTIRIPKILRERKRKIMIKG